MNEIHPEHSYQCQIEHIERVKPYGPHLDHLVVDLLIENRSNSSLQSSSDSINNSIGSS